MRRTLIITECGKKSTHTTKSDLETEQVAASLARTLHGGAVIALSGELGAGKTTFVKGLARGFGVAEMVTSPTFVIMSIYPFSLERQTRFLCHIDCYRLSSPEELIGTGAQEYIGRADTVTAIEWPERVESLLPTTTIKIQCLHDKRSAE